MKWKINLGLIIIAIFSTFVFASDNAPPPIPTEYWGRALIDGKFAADGTKVTSSYGNATVASGYYDIILTGGDSPLTYLADPTCATHWASGEACIPCSTNPTNETYCVEGPKSGDKVIINFNGNPVSIVWGDNQSINEKILSQVQLYGGWNMVGLASQSLNDSIQNLLEYINGTKLVDYYNTSSSTWKRYNSGTPPFTWTLFSMEPGKGYWLKVDSNQKWSIVGTISTPNSVPLKTGWNLVSFRLYNNSVQTAMSQLTGTRLVDYYDTQISTWKRYNSGTPPFTWTLQEINAGKSYWVKVDSDQTWGE